MDDPLVLAGGTFRSRLMVGTRGYPSPAILRKALIESGAEIVTLSMRRQKSGILDILQESSYRYLPNTAGCFTARDAVLTAQLSREALETNWIKLEVIGDEATLYPNGRELLRAAENLVAQGFCVFPYCSDDPILCRQLEEIGCVAVMPLASPIGSRRGIANPYNLRMICDQATVPVIVDAGIGVPSDVAQALELGAAAVLLNTAIAEAPNPVQMATAMRHAALAGRMGMLCGS